MKSSIIYACEANLSTADSIADMEGVLAKFGIDTNFRSVPLKYYRPMETDAADSDHELTISQRIKTLVRKAKNSHTHKHC